MEATFTDTGSLKTLSRIHSGEKPYHCELCAASFTNASNLKRHYRIYRENHTSVNYIKLHLPWQEI